MKSLREEVRVLRDAIDELRTELQWLANNREPIGEPSSDWFVVKQMAADPCAKDWADRLVIERGDEAIQKSGEAQPESAKTTVPSVAPTTKPPPGRLFAEPGEQTQLF